MKTTLKITGNWHELKTKLKQKYPNLTDSDLVYSAGKEDALLAMISKKSGKTQDEISHVINNLQSKSPAKASNEKERSRKENEELEAQEESEIEEETSRKH